MRSPKERAVWGIVWVLLLAGSAAAWWAADQWTPHAGPWATRAWRSVTRPPVPDRSASPPAARKAAGGDAQQDAPEPRKCVQSGRTTYTDQPCPPGSDEQLMEPAANGLPR